MRSLLKLATTCSVSSVDASSTTISSKSWYVWARTLRIAERRNAERLCVGIMTLTLGIDHLSTREGSADQHAPGATSQRATPRQDSRRARQQPHPAASA